MVAQQPGSFDTTFGTGGKVATSQGGDLYDLQLQNNGKIVAVGHIDPAGTYDRFAIARYNNDGSIDNSFGSQGKVHTLYGQKCGANAVAIQQDGKIVVVGYTSNSTGNSGNTDVMVARYNTEGTLDTSFNMTGILTIPHAGSGSANAVALQSDGKILVGGQEEGKFFIARLLPDGLLDESFGTGGMNTSTGGSYAEIFDIDILPDGLILGSGRIGNIMSVVRYTANGIKDQSFGSFGTVSATLTANIAILFNTIVLPGGEILIGGGAINTNASGAKYNGVIVKYTGNGLPVSNFGQNGVLTTDMGTGLSSMVRDMVLVNNKIIIAFAAGPSNNWDYKVGAFNLDGQLDTTFGNGGYNAFDFGYPYSDYIHSMVLQPDGKVVVGGQSAAGGFSMARLHTEQSLSLEVIKNTGLLVYPNPATSYIKISLPENSTDATFALYDILGKNVRNYTQTESGSSDVGATLSLEGIHPGVYLLHTQSSGGTTVTKIIKK